MSQFFVLFVACVVAVASANILPAKQIEDSAELERKYQPEVTALAHGVHKLTYKNELKQEECMMCQPQTTDEKDSSHKCGCTEIAAIQCQLRSMRQTVEAMKSVAKKVEAIMPASKEEHTVKQEMVPVITKLVPASPANPASLVPNPLPRLVPIMADVQPMIPTPTITTITLNPGQKAGNCGPPPPCAAPRPGHPYINDCSTDSQCSGEMKCCSFCGMKCKAPHFQPNVKYV
jgi:hypothetical protein